MAKKLKSKTTKKKKVKLNKFKAITDEFSSNLNIPEDTINNSKSSEITSSVDRAYHEYRITIGRNNEEGTLDLFVKISKTV